MQFTVDPKYIKAMLLCAAKAGSTRAYLSGVMFRTYSKTLVIAATDGKRLLVAQPESEIVGDGEVLVPRELLERIVKWSVSKYVDSHVTFYVDAHEDKQSINVKGNFGDAASAYGDSGKFPDIDAIIPKSTSGEHAVFPAAQLVEFGKVAKLLSADTTRNNPTLNIRHNGLSAAIVQFDGCIPVWGLIMPTAFKTEQFAAVPASFRPQLPAVSPVANEELAEAA